ncbi:hypothetical protein SNOG_08139 [Parastagonospora nodorum SN15]|uniref:Uncharacterized protein n=1 Tax=Phaeosphaeria nodorum (strain SN15 / ATCC MYA-4574 / FGSC 10173) TaxID=321614 RepID=Q0UJC5_PHANO|nr:hypothetical protein SNOG_08139 [Parastagonospora nodorum SN15]EAT84415.1 hypothetical protein SNOG_08139 [Parastagonospora nodorum SN15]
MSDQPHGSWRKESPDPKRVSGFTSVSRCLRGNGYTAGRTA